MVVVLTYKKNGLFGGRHVRRFGGPAFVLILVTIKIFLALFALIRP